MNRQRDLFDQTPDQIGGRQTDLEDLIEEKSLLAAIMDRDAEAEARIMARAKAGIRIRLM